MDRRTFLKTTAVLAATVYSRFPACASELEAVSPALRNVDYGETQITEGPLRRQFLDTQALFLSLDNDRLLKVFRQRAGLPAPGEEMGGWYNNAGFHLAYDSFGLLNYDKSDFTGMIPGHSFGQYISGLARGYAATGDSRLQDKVHQLVRGYAETLDEQGTFFIDYRQPCYVYDKLAIGLLDAHRYTQDPIALDVHEKLTRAALPHLPPKALTRGEMRARTDKDESYTWDEPYTLPENLFLAYQVTKKSLYKELAIRYLQDEHWFVPLARGENILAGEHASSHVNSLSSAVQAYLVLGSKMHLEAARNAFDMIETTQTFATGGWGPGEFFVVAGEGQLGESLQRTYASFETVCGAYTHFKICRYLLLLTGDSRYGDSMERILFNSVLGAKRLEPEGSSFYYANYQPNASKFYYRDKWPCCSGTLPQLTADYHISIYFQTEQALYVNLFVPSTVKWTAKGLKCKLRQETDFPASLNTRITIETENPVSHTIAVRVPAWAGTNAVLKVNGMAVLAASGQFVPITRTWKNGDVITLALPANLRLVPLDEHHSNLMALMAGPSVLFAVTEKQPVFTRQALFSAQSLADLSGDWVARTVDGAMVVLRSFPNIGDEHYSTYVSVPG